MTLSKVRLLRATCALLALVSLTQCKEDAPKSDTGLLLKIWSDATTPPVVRLKVLVRDLDTDWVSIEIPLDRDISTLASAYTLFLRPSSLTTGEFRVYIQGMSVESNITYATAAAATYTMQAGSVVSVELKLLSNFVDGDGDSFERCDGPGCDCDDNVNLINPFTAEICGDHIDNNCSGLPVDEGCPCAPEGAERACSRLPDAQVPQYGGIGACRFGVQRCVSDGAGSFAWEAICSRSPTSVGQMEIPNNGIDDNCDGAVDEGSSCTTGDSRRCLLGRIDTTSFPDFSVPSVAAGETPYQIDDFSLTQFNVDWKGTRCMTGLQRCSTDGRWEGGEMGCVGEVRPQPAPPEGEGSTSRIGYAELLPATPAAMRTAPTPCHGNDCWYFPETGQCDGIDNDCDFKMDEDESFDVDQDHFTRCGTCKVDWRELLTDGSAVLDDNPCGSDAADTTQDYNVAAAFVDCADGDAPRNPGATEDCRTSADDDCRCDHGPGMGQPSRGLPNWATQTSALDNCIPNDSTLRCGTVPRSDTHLTGLCSTDETELCDPTCPGNDSISNYRRYYAGYHFLGATAGNPETPYNRDCYKCPEEYGYACSEATGTCTTKSEDCTVCDVEPTAADRDEPPRAICEQPRDEANTCIRDEPPQWGDITGDPNNECPFVSCAGYYWGRDAEGRCFLKRDQDADTVVCKAGGDCQTAADLCDLEPNPNPSAVARPLCTKATGGCTGQAPAGDPVYTNQDSGNEIDNECAGTFDNCNAAGAGGGPFYFGIVDPVGDGRTNPECYLRATAPGQACNGAGACQSRREACSAAGQGDKVTRPACQQPVSGCITDADGTPHAPVFVPVGEYQDPYLECPGAATCDGDPDGAGALAAACNPQQGQSCGFGGQCENGLTCVDGVCCNSACNGSCQACTYAKTGIADGTCAPVTSGIDPDNECSSCQTCNGAGACGNVPNGQDPMNDCAALGCSNTGVCNGNGQCQTPAANTDPNNACPVCQACNGLGACTNVAGGQDPLDECTPTGCSNTGVCNGNGACATPTAGTDPNNACNATGCATTGLCDGSGACAVPANATDPNNFCPSCQMCNGGGACTNVAAGQDPLNDCTANGCANTGTCNGLGACQVPVVDTDPNNFCTAAACTNSGDCDGAGACKVPSAGTDPNGACAASGCGNSGFCNGSGSCQVPTAGTDPNNFCSSCRVCNGAGSCSDVASGLDPKNDCTTGSPGNTDSCKGANCNGSGACQYLAGEQAQPACKRCNGSSYDPVNLATDSQDVEGSNTCNGTCQKCFVGSCINQMSTEDLFNQCDTSATPGSAGSCRSSTCSGVGAYCGYLSAGEQSQPACMRCSGGSYDPVNVADNTRDSEGGNVCNGTCEKCSAGACDIQTSAQDLFGDCTTAAAGTAGSCRSPTCSGLGTYCGYLGAGEGSQPACKRCSGASYDPVNILDNTQDSEGSNLCSSTCQKCSSGACVNQLVSEDLFSQCTTAAVGTAGSCRSPNCSGSGAACGYLAAGENGQPACKRCSGSSYDPVNLTNDTQDTEGGNTCTGTCQKCSAGSCGNQLSSEDLFGHCTTAAVGNAGSCRSPNCSGSGAACGYLAAGENAQPACKRCNGSSYDPVNVADNTQDAEGANTCNATCVKCTSGACENQLASEDLFSQCTTAAPGSAGSCRSPNCNGSGAACGYLAPGENAQPACERCDGTSYNPVSFADGTQDNEGSNQCVAVGYACYAASCLLSLGETCTADALCASNHCECTSANCAVRACDSVACFCGYDAASDGTCDDFLTNGVKDPEDCTGTHSCNGAGVCP